MTTDEDVRLLVYESFAASGHPPTSGDIARATGLVPAEAQAALQRLAGARHIVLGDDASIVMAHPFAAVPLGFAVMGRQTLWWGGCAWDAFALPHVLPEEGEVLVSTRCPGCGRALACNVGQVTPPEGSEVAHFLVPVSRIWDDVVHACGNQRLYCSQECVDRWLAQTGHPRGYVMDLATLWRLASHWYDGRLDRGYVRREPIAAADYFREVGLTGPFWGL